MVAVYVYIYNINIYMYIILYYVVFGYLKQEKNNPVQLF